MTAIFMARLPDGIMAAADGAFYTGEGILSGISSKLILFPEYDAIITLQGPFYYHTLIRSLLAGSNGFDGILARIVEVADAAYRAPSHDTRYSRKFMMLLGGYSQARQARETYWLGSEADPRPGDEVPEAWTLTPAMATAWRPNYGRAACIAAGMDPDRGPIEQGFGPDEFALRVICAGRAELLPIHGTDGPSICQVGGFVQIARMQRGFVATEIVHRWPEAIGERLDPTRAASDQVGS